MKNFQLEKCRSHDQLSLALEMQFDFKYLQQKYQDSLSLECHLYSLTRK